MFTEQTIYLLCALLNVGLAGCCANWLRRRTKLNELNTVKAKNFYSFVCVCQGILSSIGLLFAYDTFRFMNFAHGAALLLILLFSLGLTVVLLVAGRIIIGWEPMRW